MPRYIVNDKTQTVHDAEHPDERCNLDDATGERDLTFEEMCHLVDHEGYERCGWCMASGKGNGPKNERA